jgi:predicted GH43/DUF377 family glycosyl hydrolase
VWGGQVLKIDDAFHMFYVGNAEDSNGIGYAISTDGLEFTKHDANPILQPDGEGFDAKGISSVAPLVVDDTWMLFYNASAEGERYGWNLPEGSSVGLATAPGPTGPWTAGQLVLKAGGDGEWDSGYILPTSVFFTEDGYRMYYVAESEPLDYDMMCGLATSEDGIDWTKYDDPSTTEAPFAESDPVMQPSRSGWDSLGVGCSVMRTDKGWEMIFDGWSPSTTGHGYASSSDGINWSKYPKKIGLGNNVDSPTSAIKINSTYYIFSYDYGTSSIITATGTIDQVVSFPKGEYLDEFGNIISLEDGDKFTIKLPAGTFIVEEGQYTVDGDIITFLENEVCPPVEGVYRWSVGENGRLEFELIEENCEFRTFEAGLDPLP